LRQTTALHHALRAGYISPSSASLAHSKTEIRYAHNRFAFSVV